MLMISIGTLALAQIHPGSTIPETPGTVQVSPRSKCCIAGEYEGYHKDNPGRACSQPGEGPFKMVIYQEERCGSKIWGEVVESDGSVKRFTGTVAPSRQPSKCCNIRGEMREPGKVIRFKGTLCPNPKDGKWEGKGNYTERGGKFFALEHGR